MPACHCFVCMDSVICRLWLNAPFVMLGLWDERQEVRVPLFNNYNEQATTPFVVFRATLQAGPCSTDQLQNIGMVHCCIAKVHCKGDFGFHCHAVQCNVT